MVVAVKHAFEEEEDTHQILAHMQNVFVLDEASRSTQQTSRLVPQNSIDHWQYDDPAYTFERLGHVSDDNMEENKEKGLAMRATSHNDGRRSSFIIGVSSSC